MGFLKAGKPLSWTDSLEHARYVRQQGIEQFLEAYFHIVTRSNDVLLWGDEIEYHVVHFDEESRTPKIALVAPQVIEILERNNEQLEEQRKGVERTSSSRSEEPVDRHLDTAWRPEYGAWMVEATPGRPYGNLTTDLPLVQLNMARRRSQIQDALRGLLPSTRLEPCSLVAFPMLGVGNDFTTPSLNPGGPYARSKYFPDGAICPHPRFGTLTANIRRRRGENVNVLLPLYQDKNTDMLSTVGYVNSKALADEPAETEDKHNHVYKTEVEAGKLHLRRSYPAACLDHPNEEILEKKEACSPDEFTDDTTRACDVSTDERTESQTSIFPQGHVHMDAMGFGMGCCCLQVTFQARDIRESRYLYDQLAVLSPLLLALTANTAVLRGRLVDVDTRWDIISASVDCRTPSEREGKLGMEGLDPAVERRASELRREEACNTPENRFASEEARKHASKFSKCDEPPGTYPLTYWQQHCENAGNAAASGCRPITKSRYGSIDLFISDADALKDEYNDLPVEKDEAMYEQLLQRNVDERLAAHVSHLFIRDPLVIFSDRIGEVGPTEHFENIQSTNWHSVRWKPPPSDSPDTGVRVELRTMEAQLTDFENAAFTVFTVLVSRVILFFDLNLYIPISKVDENFARARTRDAATNQSFFFRKHVVPLRQRCPEMQMMWASQSESSDFEEMTASEILLGKDDYPGLIPLVFAYLDILECDANTKAIVDVYMRLIADRARGNVKTGARWQRDFIRQHPLYKQKQDSVVPPEIAYDLLEQCSVVARGKVEAPELVGEYAVEVEQCLRNKGSAYGAELGRKLRGASFAEEIMNSSEFEAVHQLIASHVVKPGSTFESTPGFLSLDSAGIGQNNSESGNYSSSKLQELASRLDRNEK